ncbi:MAG: DNA-processing protein DprA [Bacteroidales bacterium]
MLYEKLIFSMLPSVGDKIGKKILSSVSLEELFLEGSNCLDKVPDMTPRLMRKIKLSIKDKELWKRAENELNFMEKNNVRMTFLTDQDFPMRLKYHDDCPNLLFYKGTLPQNPLRTLAIVGTRKSTDYGAKVMHRFLEDLIPFGVTIVSGLAYGIDTIAHRESLDFKYTNISVLAHGLQMIYPQVNHVLAKRISENGCLLTEFKSSATPERENFPRRNRIVAGLSDAVLVVESAKKGGALITAEIANGYNKDVFSFPGRIDQPLSEGCNYLIRDNKAALITCAKDLVKMMNWEKNKKRGQTSLFVELNAIESQVVDIVRREAVVAFDFLVGEMKIRPGILSGILLELEFKGLLTPMPGNYFRLN